MFLLLLFGTGGLAFALIQEADPAELLKAADQLLQDVARLRKLEPIQPVQKGVKSRDEISQYLNEHVRKNYSEGELQREGKMLKRLGLIPPDIDYQRFLLSLLTEQVGGYYDPEKKIFFIAGWLPLDQQKPVLVHELTHALQDQHFNLQRFLEEGRKLDNDDQNLAHQAIFEGDGMAVMLDFMLEGAGRNFTQLPDLAFVMRAQFTAMDAQYEVFKRAPMYLKEVLLFPYGYGAAFLQKVRANDQPWSAVDKLYADLPASTEQIIHSEKYLAQRDEPKKVEAEDPSLLLGKNWKPAYRNVLGEFSLFLLLKLHVSEELAKRAAAGWGGDQVLLLEENSGARSAVVVSSVWDTPEDAQEFYVAFTQWLDQRFPKARKLEGAVGSHSLTEGGEYHSIKQDGLKVRFVLGIPESESPKLRAW